MRTAAYRASDAGDRDERVASALVHRLDIIFDDLMDCSWLARNVPAECLDGLDREVMALWYANGRWSTRSRQASN
jgi:hypothetical protein